MWYLLYNAAHKVSCDVGNVYLHGLISAFTGLTYFWFLDRNYVIHFVLDMCWHAAIWIILPAYCMGMILCVSSQGKKKLRTIVVLEKWQ